VTHQSLVNNLLSEATGKKRFFAAIAGPPAYILEKLNLLDRKGSPKTFDVAGLHLLLSGLQNQTEVVAAPVFDREQDFSRGSAKLIYPADHIILIEGNYLLCNTSPWSTLHSFFDTTISLKSSIQTIEERLVQRWLDHDHTIEQAKARTHHNDLPNAEYVIEHSINAEHMVNT